MFPAGYFAPRYFAQRYFPRAIPSRVRYFQHGYFARHYFPDRYFPGEVQLRVRYFPHRFFAQRYFPDAYFPGNLSSGPIEPPIVPPTVTAVGGGFPGIYIPPIRLVADLVIPAPEFSAFGFVIPASVTASVDLLVPPVDLAFTWQVRSDAQPIGVVSSLVLPSLAFSATLASRRPKPGRSRAEDEAEEQMLLEHYMLTLAMTRKR